MSGQGKYGFFDPDRREYVVTTPLTPTPWINYLGDGEYGGIISNTAGGYSFDRDPRYRRVLRYRYNSIPEDQPGRYLYLRDDETGEIWSATWQPVKASYESFECRHGLGYTAITQVHGEIESSVTYFVPPGEKLEYWRVSLANRGDKPRKLSLFSYAEFCFFDAIKDQQNVDWVQQIQQGAFEDGIIFWNAFMKTWDYIFMAASQPPHSFDTSRDAFIGRLRDLSRPQRVEEGRCGNSLAHRGNGVGAFCHQIELGPGGQDELVYALGVTPEKEAIASRIQDLIEPAAVMRQFEALRSHWRHYLDSLQVQTPDAELNLMLNTWNPYQCKATFNWSRFVSLYQLGIDRGMGLRDSAQDILGVVHAVPGQARTLLLKLIGCQFEDGHAYHLFYPLTGEGGMGEAQGGKYNWYSDDHLWLIEATVAYLKETGDLALLGERVAYAESPVRETVWRHLLQAVNFTASHLGEHGIPLNGFADWNDALNLDRGLGRAESAWTGMLFCRELNLLVELAGVLGRESEAAGLRQTRRIVAENLNRHAWDGGWYLQAFDDDGKKVGSSGSGPEEQIYLNPQSWAVLSGIADRERAEKAIANAVQILGSEYGVALLYPAYQAFRPDRGGVTTYPPGAKENGGIFVHTNPWLIVAELLLEKNEEAYDLYRRILPVRKNELPDLHEVEPYVYCQNILGPAHPQFGLGRNSWLTGTAAWAYVAGTQYLLGIRPDYQGLIVEPRIPAAWDGFSVRRRFRGREVAITVRRGPQRGAKLNGIPLDRADFVPLELLATDSANRLEIEI
jgi:cellobiose phosphorylase